MEKENKILIFRTSITQRRDIKRIGELLAEFPQIDKWNVDFEDWEKILRRRCVVMHDAPLFLFITIQICSLSLSCDLLKISLIYVFPASKNSSCKLIKQSNQPVHTLFCQFCTHLFYIEGNG